MREHKSHLSGKYRRIVKKKKGNIRKTRRIVEKEVKEENPIIELYINNKYICESKQFVLPSHFVQWVKNGLEIEYTNKFGQLEQRKIKKTDSIRAKYKEDQ